MHRRGRTDEAHLHQRLADEATRHHAADREIDAAFEQRLVRAREHRLDQLDARIRSLTTEFREAVEQQPGRIDDLDREPQLGLPAARELGRGTLEPTGLDDESTAASVERLSGGRRDRPAAHPLEELHAEQVLELADRVRDRGLRSVQPV